MPFILLQRRAPGAEASSTRSSARWRTSLTSIKVA
jgi:hypothetical protein